MLPLLVAVIMIIGIMPAGVWVAEAGSPDDLRGPVGVNYNTSIYQHIYYGEYNNSPIRWRILDKSDEEIFILTDDFVTKRRFNVYSNIYYDSEIRSWLNGTFLNSFTAEEEEAMNPYYKNTDKFFLLSIGEASNTTYFPCGRWDRKMSDYWWLRSLPTNGGNGASAVYDYGAICSGLYRYHNRGVRPASKLNLESVLFTSAAGCGDFATVGSNLSAVTPISGDMKLTIEDSSQTLNIDDVKANSYTSGNTVIVNYSGASTSDSNYLCVELTSESNTYHGVIKQLTAGNESGEASFTLPISLDNDNYTLKLWNEQYNAAYHTNYASSPVEFNIRLVPIVISNASLPIGIVGESYNAILTEEGGTSPYVWSVAGLPSGLCLDDSTGEITGTPEDLGTFDVTVTVTDGNTNTDIRDFTLTVCCSNLADLTQSYGTLSPVFDPYVLEYTSSVPYTVDEITINPTLMDNNATVTVNGKEPPEPVNLEVGENTVNIFVTANGVSNKTYRVFVTRNEELIINNESLPIGVVGESYNSTLTALGATASYTWNAIGLPSGLSLDDFTGEISGIPEDTGTFNVTATVTDKNKDTDIKDFTLTIYQTFSIDLANLMVSPGTLSPEFNKNTVVYKVQGADNLESIEVTADLVTTSAGLSINRQDAQSGVSQTVDLEQGANLIPVVVSFPGVNNQKSYIISVDGTVSDADLDNLTLSTESESWMLIDDGVRTGSAIEPDTEYYVNVGNDTKTIDIAATPSDGKAFVLIDGNVRTGGAIQTVDLKVGENPIEVMVVAQDATTKTYTVNVYRGTGNVNLKELTLNHGTSSIDINLSDTEYKASVPYTVEEITVTPIPMGDGATVTVNGENSSRSVDLEVGPNTITIVVTGKDGISSKTYEVTIERKDKLTINNESLPIGMVGVTYSAILTAEGGTRSYTWTATGLPDGLELDGNKITGKCEDDEDEGNYKVKVTVTDGNNEATKELDLKINLGCGNGGYIIKPVEDSDYSQGFTDDGIVMMTINEGITGFKHLMVSITPVNAHIGEEVVVFAHYRNEVQINIDFVGADFDEVNRAGAGFNLKPGDIIKVWIVDDISKDVYEISNIL